MRCGQSKITWIESPRVPRNIFTALLIIITAGSATARFRLDTPGALTAVLDGILVNKVAWLCLGVAVWHLYRSRSSTVAAPHLAAALPALFCGAFVGGLMSWAGLCLSLLLLLLSTESKDESRVGVSLALVTALHQVVVEVLGLLGGDAILGIEAVIVGFVTGLFIAGFEVQGNALQSAGGQMIVLVWGCSSLSNLGSALLLFWALLSVRMPGLQLRKERQRVLGYAILLGCITVALNVLRLALMASDQHMYEFLHAAEGSALFRMATLGLTAIMGMSVLSR